MSALTQDQSPDILAVRPGDTVKISTRHGQLRSGRAMMPTRDGGWVLCHRGQPILAYPGNLVAIRHRKAATAS